MTRSLHRYFTSGIVALLLFQTPFASAEFVHPGVAYSGESIAFIRSKIEAEEQPWTKAWEVVAESAIATLERKPEPFEHVKRGPYNNPDIGSSEFSSDATAAQLHAVCWTLSGEEAHARKAAEILDAWSGKLKAISDHDAALLTGMTGYKYVVAAELLKHTWDGWPVENQTRFATMLRDVFYPLIEDFYPSANGNWDASMLQVMIAMGVFLDDLAMFDKAKNYFLKGPGNGAIGNYFKPSGQCQESGRDQAHTQMGLDFLAATCETAWIQGVDLYGALDNRLLKGFEYTTKYNLGHEVPYEPYRSYKGRYFYKKISDDSRGRFRPMYERVFNHYHNRKKLEAPFTKEAAERLRTEREGRDRRGRERRRNRNLSSAQLETLMYAGHPATFDSKKSEK